MGPLIGPKKFQRNLLSKIFSRILFITPNKSLKLIKLTELENYPLEKSSRDLTYYLEDLYYRLGWQLYYSLYIGFYHHKSFLNALS